MTEITIDEYLNNTDDYLKVDELKVTGKAPEDCIELFAGFKGEKLDLSDLDTSNVINMECFFEDCYFLKEVNLTGLDTSKVTDMGWFFCGCYSLKKVNLSGLDTSKAISMCGFFAACKSLEEIDLSDLDTSNVKDMNCFFDNCYSLKEINLTDLNTSNVKDMHGFFCDCESLKKLDLSSFNLENCKNTKYMFEGVEAEITASDPKIIKAVRKEQDRREEKNQTISNENDMKKIECFQPRGLVKLLCGLLCAGMIIGCASMTNPENSITEAIVAAVLFGFPILLSIFGILMYKISVKDKFIVIRKWYGIKKKIKLENITKVVMASSTGKAIDAVRIHVYVGKRRIFSLDPILENYEEMQRYIINNIDEEKIEIIS